MKRRDGFAERVPLRRPRIKRRTRHPDASGRVERDIHRLLDLRLGRNQLDLKTRWQMEACALLRGRTQPGIRRVAALGGGHRGEDYTEEKVANEDRGEGVVGHSDEVGARPINDGGNWGCLQTKASLSWYADFILLTISAASARISSSR